MGAFFVTSRVAAERDQLQKVYINAVRDAQYEAGGGYSGTIAESTGLTITNKVFKDTKAIEWLEENAEKWGDTLAIRVEPECPV